jgi:hypothetical protein
LTQIKALAAKVATLDKALAKYRKELGSAEALNIKSAVKHHEVHEHANHVLETSFGQLGAETVFIDKHTDE